VLFLPDLHSKSLLPSSFVGLLASGSFALIFFGVVVVLTQNESEAEAT
jgi:hypothetical protein